MSTAPIVVTVITTLVNLVNASTLSDEEKSFALMVLQSTAMTTLVTEIGNGAVELVAEAEAEAVGCWKRIFRSRTVAPVVVTPTITTTTTTA